ncbi:MAG: low molecular weight phosphotyrosine protein phosphatase [Clostridia bacterium]|nr:low molecular weight phosphotyrosine protein phosphatase [Clostridia bacterium]MBQ4098680.1 low molecular weight phosphotyrosine protein phosphatase [Clostridia bacterium]
MHKIMFVCHGNICRSPMAEFILKDLVKKCGRENEFIISSSATSTEEIWQGVGNPVYPPAKRELLKHGITCDGKRAVQLKAQDYENYDLLICMDSANVRNATRILNGDKKCKIKKLLSFVGSEADVADPWFTNDFETTYSDIYAGCSSLLKAL